MTDRNLLLMEIIQNNPGIQFREIMRMSGLKNGVLSHYLKKFEKNGVVKVMRTTRRTGFYPPQISEEESRVIRTLRRQTPRDILLALIENSGLGFKEIVGAVGKSPSTVSVYLSQMVSDKLVEVRFVDLKKKYYIKTRDMVDRLIEDHRPSHIEKPSFGFEDVINSL